MTPALGAGIEPRQPLPIIVFNRTSVCSGILQDPYHIVDGYTIRVVADPVDLPPMQESVFHLLYAVEPSQGPFPHIKSGDVEGGLRENVIGGGVIISLLRIDGRA